ncbi:MAG: YifB family Mg chelatase-like AAA ATPase [Gammaproteobacteria bacterium]
MSLASARSRAIHGAAALAVAAETHIANGLPGFTIVGLPEAAVRESRDRVRSAVQNSGYEFPQRRITVNLAPGDIPKEGTRFDLAIAVGILAASGQVPAAALAASEFVAELALDGALRPARACVATALASAADGHDLFVGPDDAATASLVDGAQVYAAPSLAAVGRHLSGVEPLARAAPSPPPANVPAPPDLADVIGQPRARRVLEIAATGGHNLLLSGPPGTGKSMLAARLPGILPPLSEADAMAAAAVQSVAGFAPSPASWRRPPYRAPHHSASAAALVGGGRPPRPGEISLAHLGVLFLDELPEFDRRALEALREPLETGTINIARAGARCSYPARFQLVAAMNPCPCGYSGDPVIACRCSDERIRRYRSRVSGPLGERIDLHLEMARHTRALIEHASGAAESSAAVAARVQRRRERQRERQGCNNAALSGAALERHCRLAPESAALLATAAERYALSARGYHKTLRVARTLADMAERDDIAPDDVAEAVGLRGHDRSGDGLGYNRSSG